MNLNENEKASLVTYMTVCMKINEKDDSVAEDIERLNALAEFLIPGQSDSIEELILTNLRTYAAKQDDSFEKFINSHVERFKFLDLGYLRNMMVLDGAFGNVPTYAIETLLNAPNPTFSSREKEFHFYHTLSNRAIQTGNSDLIRRAIEKVQSV